MINTSHFFCVADRRGCALPADKETDILFRPDWAPNPDVDRLKPIYCHDDVHPPKKEDVISNETDLILPNSFNRKNWAATDFTA